MSPEEWALWRARWKASYGSHRRARPCPDCPLGFAVEMRAEGRCNGEPGGVEEDEDVPA